MFGKAFEKIQTTAPKKKTNPEYIYNPLGDVAKADQPQPNRDLFAQPVARPMAQQPVEIAKDDFFTQ